MAGLIGFAVYVGLALALLWVVGELVRRWFSFEPLAAGNRN
jgi:hypothetical protein